jgi:hypothetical protein
VIFHFISTLLKHVTIKRKSLTYLRTMMTCIHLNLEFRFSASASCHTVSSRLSIHREILLINDRKRRHHLRIKYNFYDNK